MTQSNLYMDDDGLELYVDVQPLTLDELKSSRDAAVNAANNAQQSAESASSALTNITTCKTNLELFYAQASDNLRELLTNLTLELNNTKNIIVSTLQSLGNTILTNINTKFNQVKSQIETLGQNYVNQAKSYAEEAQITVDNRVSTEHLIQSNALKSGEISSDSEVLSWVTKMTHSTFDRSKFTIKGTPVITDNGIASGFLPRANYLELPVKPKDLKGKNWTVEAKWVNTNADLSNAATDIKVQPLFSIAPQWVQTGGIFVEQRPGEQLPFAVALGGATHTGSESSNEGGHVFKKYSYTPDYCIATMSFDYQTGEYKLWADVGNGKEYAGSWIPNTTQKELKVIYNEEETYLKQGAGWQLQVYDAIDLKCTECIIDGVPVFSGNKTGMDTIKPDDYTVVGTPTISADGIASGFSTSNYLYTNAVASLTMPKYEFQRLVPNPNWEQEQAEKEAVRIANLHMTRGDVFRGLLLAKGVTRADIRGLIEAMPEETPEQRVQKELALIDFDEALEYYRGVALIDTVGVQLGITPEQMNNFFDTKDWHELISNEEE